MSKKQIAARPAPPKTHSAMDRMTWQVLDQWLGWRLAASDLVGAQIAIRDKKKGALWYSRAFGTANLDTGASLTPRHVGHVASNSKIFTTALLYRLQEADVLSLTDPLVDHVPALRQHSDKRFADIRLIDLMTHRSGLMRDGIDGRFWDLVIPFADRQRIVADVLARPLVFDPGQVTKYSNIGYGLLGMAIESATGYAYADLVADQVIRPLGLRRTEPDYTGRADWTYSDGHRRLVHPDASRVLPHAPARAMAAATGFCSTAEDMSACLHGVLWGDTVLPRAARRDILHNNWPVCGSDDQRYGIGFHFDKMAGLASIGHSGGYPGYVTKTKHVFDLDMDISLILNANVNDTTAGYRLFIGIAQLIQTLRRTFDEKDAGRALVSPPLMDNWWTGLFVFGPKKALVLSLDALMPADGAQILDRAGDVYRSDRTNGYGSPGEDVLYHLDAKGRIRGVDYGACRYVGAKELRKRIQGYSAKA